MEKFIKIIEAISPFLAKYPNWVKILVAIGILFAAVIIICLLFFRNPTEKSEKPSAREFSKFEQKAGGDIVGRDKITNNINSPNQSSIPQDPKSQLEIAKVKINRCFEDYDAAILEFEKKFKEDAEKVTADFAKRNMLRSSIFIQAQMKLSYEAKEKAGKIFSELERNIEDILIENFGKTSLLDMKEEFNEEINLLDKKKEGLKEIYLMLEQNSKDWGK